MTLPAEMLVAGAATRLQPGRPWPLGATVTPEGVNFALFSDHATAVVLCLYDAAGDRELARLPLPMRTDGIWHGLLPGAGAGVVYGYRVDGPHDPERGRRFNPRKLLLDPYARQVTGEFRWTDAHLADADCASLDSARDMVKAVVQAPDDFDWGDDRPLHTPLADTVVYEVHVKGFTKAHPGVPPELRGTFEGMAAEAPIAHLKRLGITAVELLPVAYAISERPLAERGLSNYWGYNTLGFFAPDRRLARKDPVREFKTMVRGLHAAGIEVILDVVFNHTCEGDQNGPMLSFKGIDNAIYYHLRPGHRAFYENFTGTGNALNLNHPRVLQMVMDCLRFWVGEMHVDGFRFDLATTLGRGEAGFDARAAFFHCVRQDPMLAGVKLIAEPWDVGFGGYQVGRFPTGWADWNDRYRDSVRAFWVRKAAYRGEIASRIAGSSELFSYGGRPPQASVNYVTAHDGFTLHDLVSYNERHNEANGEDNRDGHPGNHSWNCGNEGPTDLLAVVALRSRLKRALLATLMVSQGVPMLLGGDELGRTQDGNNNAYCQDNPIGWFDWNDVDDRLVAFTARVIALRKRVPQFRRTDWLTGQPGPRGKDVIWLNRQGREMVQRQWEEAGRYAFGFVLTAGGPGERDVLVLLNGEASDWTMPLPNGRWRMLLDTGQRDGLPPADSDRLAIELLVKARCVTVLERADDGGPTLPHPPLGADPASDHEHERSPMPGAVRRGPAGPDREPATAADDASESAHGGRSAATTDPGTDLEPPATPMPPVPPPPGSGVQ